MPLYEYLCTCGYEWDDLQPMPGQPTMMCVKCGKMARKVMAPCNFHFKGSGFYATDYPKERKVKDG